jgi:hypothetical protein
MTLTFEDLYHEQRRKWVRKRKQLEQLEKERNKEDNHSQTGLDQTE